MVISDSASVILPDIKRKESIVNARLMPMNLFASNPPTTSRLYARSQKIPKPYMLLLH